MSRAAMKPFTLPIEVAMKTIDGSNQADLALDERSEIVQPLSALSLPPLVPLAALVGVVRRPPRLKSDETQALTLERFVAPELFEATSLGTAGLAHEAAGIIIRRGESIVQGGDLAAMAGLSELDGLVRRMQHLMICSSRG